MPIKELQHKKEKTSVSLQLSKYEILKTMQFPSHYEVLTLHRSERMVLIHWEYNVLSLRTLLVRMPFRLQNNGL